MDVPIDRPVFEEEDDVGVAESCAEELMERFAAAPEGGEFVEECLTVHRLAYDERLIERAAHRDPDAGVRMELADLRKARRRKRKEQTRSRRRNR